MDVNGISDFRNELSSVSQFIDMWKLNCIKLILLHNDDHNTLYSLETIKYLSVDKLFLHIIRR